jgi:hypothetical protein
MTKLLMESVMSLKLPEGLGAHGTNSIGAPFLPVGKTPVKSDTYGCKLKSMNLLPDFLNLKGSRGAQCLKAVLFGATAPLLPFFLMGHAVAVVCLNAKNSKVTEKVKDLNNLINQKKELEHQRAVQKSLVGDSVIARKEYTEERIASLREAYKGQQMPKALELKLKLAETSEIKKSWLDEKTSIDGKIKDIDSQIVSLKKTLGIKE